MNNLSWLIYAAEVGNKVQGVGHVLNVLGIICAIVSAVLGAAYAADNKKDFPKEARRYVKLGLCLAFLGAVLNVFTPGRQTVLLVAASQIAETTLQSQQAQQLVGKVIDPGVDLLNAWMRKQTQDIEAGLDGKKSK